MNELLELRKTLKLTQRQAALMVGVDQVTWNRWERGVNKPSLEHAELITKLRSGSVEPEPWMHNAADNILDVFSPALRPGVPAPDGPPRSAMAKLIALAYRNRHVSS